MSRDTLEIAGEKEVHHDVSTTTVWPSKMGTGVRYKIFYSTIKILKQCDACN